MPKQLPIYLFTDYGLPGPYVGLLHAAVRRQGCSGEIIDLQHDLPAFDPVAAGILLRHQLPYLPEEAVVCAVIDPGVGGERKGLIIQLDHHWLVGPDNGLFAPLLSAAKTVETIDWQPAFMSATFHGRDWFVPVAARLAMYQQAAATRVEARSCVGYGRAGELPQVIYVDGFGNAMTGMVAEGLKGAARLEVKGRIIQWARTFGDVPVGQAFWYANSLGLVEIAVNQGSALSQLGIELGDAVTVLE
jgi:hypothetical protein